MRKLLIVAAAAVSLVAGVASPSDALTPRKSVTATKAGPYSDCVDFTVKAALQEPRLVNTQPFNLGFAAEIGNHKAQPPTRCGSQHYLKVAFYLYTLPVNGPRTLVATNNAAGLCYQCFDLLAAASATVPPGIYQLVGDFSIDNALATSVATTTFLYTGLDIYEFHPLS